MKDEKAEQAFKHLIKSRDMLMKAAEDEETEESIRTLCALVAVGTTDVIEWSFNYCFERKYGEKR